MAKIIWGTKELENEMRLPNISEFPPLGRVTVDKQSMEHIKEVSTLTGTVSNWVVYLPPGVRDRVWVSILLNGSSLCRAVGGDNQYHSGLAADDIRKGDTVEVIVKNLDTVYRHRVGVRVEVQEDSLSAAPVEEESETRMKRLRHEG